MRIGMILPSCFPPDIRVEKELATLRAEHEVVLLCERRGSQLAVDEWQGIRVRRVFSPLQRLWSKLNVLANCRSRLWERAIDAFINEEQPDVLHVHDLPLLAMATVVAARHGLPVVADLHENYPAMLAEVATTPLRSEGSLGGLVGRLVVSVPRWEAYERRAVPRADHVVVVVDEARDRLIANGVEPGRVHVVGNYATLDDAQPTDQSGDRFCVVYAGGFSATRDLMTVVDAVAALPQARYPDLEVVLVGGKGRELRDLTARAHERGVSDRMSILGWLPRSEAERLMEGANLGLVPHRKSPHTDATIPHKIFQYMWRRLPVIVSDCAPLQRIVHETGAGLAYKTGDAAGLARCIAELYDDRALAARMGDAGHDAVARKYNWDQAGEVLLQLYRSIEARA